MKSAPRVRLSPPLLIALLSNVGACVPAGPPVMHPSSVTAPVIPSPPRLSDPAALGYVRARQVPRLAERLGLGAQLARIGVDLSPIRHEEPIVILVGKPPTDRIEDVPLVALLPTSLQGPIGKMIAMFSPGPVSAVGESTMVLYKQASGSPMEAEVQSIARAPMVNNIDLYLHQSSIMERWGDKLRQAMAKSQADLAAQGTSDQKVFAASTDWMLGWLNSIEALSIGLASSDATIELSSIRRDKAGPSGERALPGSATGTPELSRFLPAGDVRMEIGSRNLNWYTDITLRFYQPILEGHPDTLARLKALMKEWQGSGARHDMAMSLSFGGEHGFSASAVSQTPDAGRQFEAMEKMYALMQEEPLASLVAKSGVTMTSTFEKGVRHIREWPVNRYTYSVTGLKNGKNLGPELERLLKTIVLEVAQVGQFLVYGFNAAPGALEAVVEDLYKAQPKTAPLVARTVNGPGGSLYADADVPALVEHMQSLLPAERRRSELRLDPAIARVTLFGYEAGDLGYHRLQVPRDLIFAIRAALN